MTFLIFGHINEQVHRAREQPVRIHQWRWIGNKGNTTAIGAF
jgi:hypothetical protein